MDLRTMDYVFKKYVYDYIQPPSPTYYNRVYLCIEKKNLHSLHVIEGFQCYRCMNMEQANKEKAKKEISTKRCSLIPICKWIPFFMDPYILNYKLKKQFWLGNHTFYQRKH
jgi:hypothetical protein